MKVVAYVEKIVPVEVEVDDKWKRMEDYGNAPYGVPLDDLGDYFDENWEEFYNDVCKTLNEMDESGCLCSIETITGGNIMDGLQED